MWTTEHLKWLLKVSRTVGASCPIALCPGATFSLATSKRDGTAPAWSRGLPSDGGMADSNRERLPCCWGLRYCRAHSEVRPQGQRGTLSVRGCVAHAGLHCACTFALHIWGCFSSMGLHCVHRKLLCFALCPEAIWVGTQMGTPWANWSAPCKPGPLNLHQGQILERLLIWNVWEWGSQVVHRASMDHFGHSHSPAGRWGLAASW